MNVALAVMLVLMCVSVGLLVLGRAAAGAIRPDVEVTRGAEFKVYELENGALHHRTVGIGPLDYTGLPFPVSFPTARARYEDWPDPDVSRFLVPMHRREVATVSLFSSPTYSSPQGQQSILDCLQPSLVERFGVELSTQPTVLSSAWMPIGMAGQAAMAGCVLAGLAAFCFYVRALWLSGALSKLRRRRRLGQCVVCEYPVGSSDSGPKRCPECGYKDEAG